MKKLTFVVAAFLASALAFAAVPAGKETLKIDLVPGTKGAVELPHAKHMTDFKKKGGAAIECKDCHHTSTSEKDVKPCTECHAKVGEAEKEVGGKKTPAVATKTGDKVDQKSIIFHKQCVDGCHKEMKEAGKTITGCKTCHKS